MAEAIPLRTSVSNSVTVRQRPAVMLLLVRARAAEATLELALSKLKKQAEETVQWLKRLGASRVDVGEPHLAEHIHKDPIKAIRADTARMLGKRSGESDGERKHEVMIVLTSQWPIAGMSAEETLVLMDRLRFETNDVAAKPKTAEETPSWASPEEQVQEIMKSLHEASPDEDSPKFLFIARLSDEQLEKACAQATALARHSAERLARSSGYRLGKMWLLQATVGKNSELRTDRLMNHQRCLALLSECSYNLNEDEIVSEDPRATEFAVRVCLSYHLE
jgi:hypothetical protein